MKIVLLVVGKTEMSWLKQGIELYLQRLKFYTPFEIKVIPGLKNAGTLSPAVQKEKEGQIILPFLTGKNEVYLLDETGREYSSVEMASFIENKINTGCRELTFVIGGPYGFSHKPVEWCAGKISLSKMTFSHQMARLLFVEQLYRAFTILKGVPYHHE